MGINGKRVWTGAAMAFAISGSVALSSAELKSSVEQSALSQEFVLQGSQLDAVARLVESVGGTVVYTIDGLDSVGVELTAEQLDLISRSALVEKIHQHGQAANASTPDTVAGNFWWFRK